MAGNIVESQATGPGTEAQTNGFQTFPQCVIQRAGDVIRLLPDLWNATKKELSQLERILRQIPGAVAKNPLQSVTAALMPLTTTIPVAGGDQLFSPPSVIIKGKVPTLPDGLFAPPAKIDTGQVQRERSTITQEMPAPIEQEIDSNVPVRVIRVEEKHVVDKNGNNVMEYVYFDTNGNVIEYADLVASGEQEMNDLYYCEYTIDANNQNVFPSELRYQPGDVVYKVSKNPFIQCGINNPYDAYTYYLTIVGANAANGVLNTDGTLKFGDVYFIVDRLNKIYNFMAWQGMSIPMRPTHFLNFENPYVIGRVSAKDGQSYVCGEPVDDEDMTLALSAGLLDPGNLSEIDRLFWTLAHEAIHYDFVRKGILIEGNLTEMIANAFAAYYIHELQEELAQQGQNLFLTADAFGNRMAELASGFFHERNIYNEDARYANMAILVILMTENNITPRDLMSILVGKHGEVCSLRYKEILESLFSSYTRGMQKEATAWMKLLQDVDADESDTDPNTESVITRVLRKYRELAPGYIELYNYEENTTLQMEKGEIKYLRISNLNKEEDKAKSLILPEGIVAAILDYTTGRILTLTSGSDLSYYSDPEGGVFVTLVNVNEDAALEVLMQTLNMDKRAFLPYIDGLDEVAASEASAAELDSKKLTQSKWYYEWLVLRVAENQAEKEQTVLSHKDKARMAELEGLLSLFNNIGIQVNGEGNIVFETPTPDQAAAVSQETKETHSKYSLVKRQESRQRQRSRAGQLLSAGATKSQRIQRI